MNRSFLRAACAAALAACAAGAHADYKAGMDALAVRDYRRARAEFEAEPNGGDAIYQLSRMAVLGLGEPKDERRAAGLLLRAMMAGNARATLDYVYFMGNGRGGVTKDPQGAVHKLEELAVKGNASAMKTLGRIHWTGWWGIPADLPRAASYFKQAMEGGDTEAKALYGTFMANGIGMAADAPAALPLLRSAADDGSPLGMTQLAYVLLQGAPGIAKDPAASLELYRRAADLGDRVGQYGVARAYMEGLGVARDPVQAVRWADAAARQGDSLAQLMLGDAFRWGRGVPKLSGEAYFWYTIASRADTSAGKSANERRSALAGDMSQQQIESALHRAGSFQVQQGFRPRATPFPALSHGNSVEVGGVSVDLPPPDGYGNAWQFVEFLQRVHPNDPDLRPLLLVLSKQEDVDRKKLSLPGPYRSIEVMHYGDPGISVSPAIWLDIKRQIRAQAEQSAATGKYRLRKIARDDDRGFVLLREGVAEADRVDAMAFLLVKQRVILLNYTGFQVQHFDELSDLARTSVDGFISANRGLFGN